MQYYAPRVTICYEKRRTWTREPDLGSLLFVEPFAPATTLNFTSSGLDGRITGYQEVSNARGALLSAKASTSLQREPANIQNFVRGSSSHVPFRPGGLDIGLESELEDDNGIITAQEMASKMEEGFDLTKGNCSCESAPRKDKTCLTIDNRGYTHSPTRLRSRPRLQRCS